VADHWVATKDQEEYIVEKLIYLPHSWLINNHRNLYPMINPEETNRKQLVIERHNWTEGTFVFANFNQLFKLGNVPFECLYR